MPIGKCMYCKQEILWAKNRANNNSNPLDPKPSPDGNLLVARSPAGIQYQALTHEEVEQAKAQGVQLYITHIATCTERPQRPARREKGVTLPEELLCSAQTKAAADDLARAIAQEFKRHTYVLHKIGFTHPFQIMTDEELSQPVRSKIKRFIKDYVAAQQQPQWI